MLLNGKLTGLWEPELLLVGRGSNTYFMQKYDNVLNLYDVILDFFVIFCLSMLKCTYDLKLYTVPFFVSGQTYKISKGSNNYCSHCIF